jgi:sodium/pantothenate symporter
MASSEQVAGTWILIALYGTAILYFVIKGALGIKSMKDYAVGSISFSPYFVGLSLAAAMTSAATFVINPGLIARYGISGVLSFGVFFPLASLASLVVLTKSFRKYGQSVSAVSLASWIGKKYNSNGFSLFIAFLSVLLITFIVLILVALAKVFASALNTNEVITLAAIVVFVFGYMMFGGANSMVYTNAIQAGIMIVVAIILIGSGYGHFKDGIGGFLEKLKSIDPVLVKATNEGSPLFRDFFEIAIVQIIIGIAVVCQPHIITKSLLLKKESDVNRFLVVAVLVEILFFSIVIAGLYSRIQFPDLTLDGNPMNTDNIIPSYVIKIFSVGWVAILVGLFVILGLISAGLSTLEGLIQSLSTSITNDIVRPLFGKNISNEKSYMAINRISIVVLGIVAFLMARDQMLNPKLSVAILAQNGVYAYFSIIFIPIVLGIFGRNVGLKPPLFASITAFVTHFTVYYGFPFLVNNGFANLGYFNKYFTGMVHNPAIAAATAIVLSAIVGLGIHIVAKGQKQANFEDNKT